MAVKELKLLRVDNDTLDATKNARVVLDSAIKSVNDFYAAYQQARAGTKGTTTHGQQDLLRAMLVFACSGLDAVIKQLIKDTLPNIIDKDMGAQKEFEKFIERTIKGKTSGKEDGAISGVMDVKLIAELFASPEPRKRLLDERLRDLDHDSLQSRDQILKIASCFAITRDAILVDPELTKTVFQARNQIIHEMDVNLLGLKKRRQRRVTAMTKYSEDVFNVAIRFINAVGKKLVG